MAITVFGAQIADGDVELLETDGTTGRTSLIKQINSTGSGQVGNNRLSGAGGGSMPFAVSGNFAYFSATDGSTGVELWRTDGTSAGTTKVSEFTTTNGTADPADDITGFYPQNIVATSNGLIFFYGYGPAASNPGTTAPRIGIWMFNPATYTTLGTGLTFIAADNGINSGSMVTVGTKVYWTYSSASEGLGGSDGTTTTPTIVSTSPGPIYDAGGTLYFLSAIGVVRKVTGLTAGDVATVALPAGVANMQSGGFVHAGTNLYIYSPGNNKLLVSTIGSTTSAEVTGGPFDFTSNNGALGHQPGFAALGNNLIFSNNRTSVGGTGSEVWIVSGGVASLLKDIVPGINSSNPHNFMTVGSSVLFQATNGNGSVDLWRTDGTVGGTVIVESLFGGGVDNNGQITSTRQMENMSVQNGVLYFSFDDGIHGSELWRSDGTPEGTLMLKELNATTLSSNVGFQPPGSVVGGANLGTSGVFMGWSQQAGYELWGTNGLAGGTGPLADIAPGGGASAPGNFTVVGTKAFFSAFSPTGGIELWSTDGSAAGTTMVKDINPGSANSYASGMTAVGSKVYFTADNGTHGNEAWVSDGTAAGTFMLIDAFPGSVSGFANGGGGSNFTAAAGKVFFTASNFSSSSGDPNTELYVTDGTAAGTLKIEVNPTGTSGRNSAFPYIQPSFTAFNGQAYFFATNGTNGVELFKSNGTAAGTSMVKNIITGDTDGTPGEDGLNPALGMFLVNSKLLFINFTFAGGQFYVSDGTDAGTVVHGGNNFSGITAPVILGTKLLFTVSSGGSGGGVYATDGTGAGPTLIGASTGSAGALYLVGGGAVFSNFDSTNGTELWFTNGVTSTLLKNINTVSNGVGTTVGSNPTNFITVGNKVYFQANNGVNGPELWVTDGTAGGTTLVKDIDPSAVSGSVQPLRAVTNSHLLFYANDGTGSELWITNGTSVGTFRATDVVQAQGSFYSGAGPNPINNTPGGNFATIPYTIPAGATGETFTGTNDPDYFDGLGGNDIISGLGGDDTLIGGANDDNISGGLGNDFITGGLGNDVLNGGGGIDSMTGGAGNDTYYVDSYTDVVSEVGGGGYDTAYFGVSFVLNAGSEMEVLSAVDVASTAAINLTGNEFGQFLFGNAGANVLDGGGGSDAMYGYGGDDWYYVDTLSDYVSEVAGAGYDRVFASASHLLAPGAEIEILTTVNTSASTVIHLTGNEYGQFIFGNNGANSIDGGGGADAMYGYGGDDYYYVDNLMDYIFEANGGGYDRVQATASHLLAPGSEIEVLRAIDPAATTAIHLTGNEYGQLIYGNNAGNSIDGGAGGDAMIGYGGDDYYYADSVLDIVFEAVGGGYDRIQASANHLLAAGQEIEVLRTIDQNASTAINLTGNEFGQFVQGNAGANRIDGGAGSDALYGYGGADQFAFTTALGGGNVDTVADFVSGVDSFLLDDAVFAGLALGALSAGAFRVGTAALDADDRIIYNQAAGALLFDADGVGGVAAVQFAALPGGPAVAASDFVVI